MRIVVIGATGTIGKPVVNLLAPQHDVVKVANKSGDFTVDISQRSSIETLFQQVGSFDAVICAAGSAQFGPMRELSDEDFELGLLNKLMGQVNLVRIGCEYINENGCFTLTSGILSQRPMRGSCSISMVNAGIEGFVRAAALELERGVRINAVSPPWVRETLLSLGMDPGEGMPADKVALAYRASLEGNFSGNIINARDFA